MAEMRKFETGATRDTDEGKIDYEGHISPLVTKRYGQYMHEHRKQADGVMRASDNWQQGIEKQAYVKSLVRHMEDVKLIWDGFSDEAVDPDMQKALCAVIFNAQGLLFELLKEKRMGNAKPLAPLNQGLQAHGPSGALQGVLERLLATR